MTIEGSPDGPVFPIPAAADTAWHNHTPCPVEPITTGPTTPRRRVGFRTPVPPGSDPQPFGRATGVVVPQPTGPAAADAMLAIERWLRATGFTPVVVPYPIRLVFDDQRVHVQCRLGLARPGVDDRIWRQGRPPSPFPLDLAGALRADVIGGPSSAMVEALIEHAQPAATIAEP